MNRRLEIGLHFLIWVLIIIQDTNDFLQYQADLFVASVGFSKMAYFGTISTLYRIDSALVFYGIAFVICPLLFKQKKYILGIGAFIGLLSAVVLYRYLIEFQILKPYLEFDNYLGKKVSAGWYIKNCLLYNFTTSKYALYGIIYFFVFSWFRRSKELKEMKYQKTEAELSFLRYQINPHFLFNSINDIYALSIKNKKETSAALLHLSSMLHYLLVDKDGNMISLDDEIVYLKNYIELQKISYKNKIYINFNTEKDSSMLQVPRLSLTPFVENAFKHGEIMSKEDPVNIFLLTRKNELFFSCSNKIKPMFKDKTSGVGLANVKRRLELIYPKSHKLLVSKKDGYFNVTLNIYYNNDPVHDHR